MPTRSDTLTTLNTYTDVATGPTKALVGLALAMGRSIWFGVRASRQAVSLWQAIASVTLLVGGLVVFAPMVGIVANRWAERSSARRAVPLRLVGNNVDGYRSAFVVATVLASRRCWRSSGWPNMAQAAMF